jgi:simple sugar transport system permease protein
MAKRSVLTRLAKLESLPIAAVLLTLYLVFMITAPNVFTGHRIYMSFLQTIPPMLVLALGLTFVITAGEIDLSFSAVVAFSGFAFSWWYRTVGEPWSALLLAILAGALVGYINGVLVAKIGVPSIMATLAAQFFWAGLTVLLAGGASWNIKGIQDEALHGIFVGRLFGSVPAQSLWALALTVFCWFLLNRHRFGEEIMFVGDNPNVARVMGINVERTKIKLFTMNGAMAGFAAMLLTTEMNTFWTTQGEGYLLPVMAAVFIGGSSIAGGEGFIVGTFFGAYIIGSLEAGVVATGIGGYWTQLVSGLVMGASVVLNIVIGDGRLTAASNRVRSWATPSRGNGG